ncbi:MAG: peptidyl-prolyl cis-trans isomerase [Solidesulfovibrio sp.]
MKKTHLAGWARGLAVACCAGLLLGGCNRDVLDEPGVVATVNGDPIRTADLEARQDLRRLGAPVVDNPSVERLRVEYGAVLADMIVARLVRQELSRLRLAVSPAELAAAERDVLADYPDGAFDRMLLEEHIDANRWREALGDRLSYEKFTREVLRQNVRVGVSEAATYYKEHIDAFTKSARLRLAIVGGKDAETVKTALAAYRKAGQVAALDGLPGITVQEVNLPAKNLSAAWREAVKPLKPGEASAVLTVGKESTVLILLARQPETVLDPAKAYARVETLLLEDKLEKAFDAWLAEALAGAKIAVSKQLVAAPADATADTADTADAVGVKTDAARRSGSVDDKPPVATPKAPRDGGKPAPESASPKEKEPTGRDEKKAAPAPEPSQSVAAVTPDRADKGNGADKIDKADKTDKAAEASPPVSDMSSTKPAAAQVPPPAPFGAVLTDVAPDTDASAAKPAPGQEGAAAKADAPTVPQASPPVAPASPVAARPEVPAVQPPAEAALKGDAGEVEFSAIKASWILYTVDDGQEDRVYLKPGKPYRIVYAKKLSVRLGSPSEIKYRVGGKETTVEVGKKESRVLEFP